MLLPVGKYFQKKPHTSSHWLKPAGVISSYYLVVYLAPHMYSKNLLPGASEVGGMGVFIPPHEIPASDASGSRPSTKWLPFISFCYFPPSALL